MDLGFDEFGGYITHRDAHVYYLDGTTANGHNPVVQNLYEGKRQPATAACGARPLPTGRVLRPRDWLY